MNLIMEATANVPVRSFLVQTRLSSMSKRWQSKKKNEDKNKSLRLKKFRREKHDMFQIQ